MKGDKMASSQTLCEHPQNNNNEPKDATCLRYFASVARVRPESLVNKRGEWNELDSSFLADRGYYRA
jgi:hypothetical protein